MVVFLFCLLHSLVTNRAWPATVLHAIELDKLMCNRKTTNQPYAQMYICCSDGTIYITLFNRYIGLNLSQLNNDAVKMQCFFLFFVCFCNRSLKWSLSVFSV